MKSRNSTIKNLITDLENLESIFKKILSHLTFTNEPKLYSSFTTFNFALKKFISDLKSEL